MEKETGAYSHEEACPKFNSAERDIKAFLFTSLLLQFFATGTEIPVAEWSSHLLAV